MGASPLVNCLVHMQRCAMTPERLSPDDARLTSTLELIQRVFAEHDGRIDPPSSMHRLTLDDLNRKATQGEIWVLGAVPKACVILSKVEGALYLSKLAVDPAARGQGLARCLIALARDRAVQHDRQTLRLETRVELTENHTTFRKLGFRKVGETAHPGFERPTSITMEKPVAHDPG